MVINRQRRVSVASSSLEQFFARISRLLHISPGAATVCLVTNAQIARWNRFYRGKAKPTDVLSFPAEASARKKRAARNGSESARGLWHSSSRNGSYLGDIAIAPAVALRNAQQSGRAFDDEMRVLMLHGLLHLLGYDHETDTGQMERLELRLRRQLGIR
ncbi:MAG TPA: rRNA maturation RNase YbeY [Candidatus Acidoferrales bacterium]|nr:rRNA maturation RNase YbeY [Candidatus Acidoferrales bacterium]